MAVWSSLCRSVYGVKGASNIVLNRAALQNVQKFRQMSGGGHNRFQIQPTRWQWTKFKDLVHFYTMVAVIPLGLISLYCNIFIGPAQLAPIPEGYTPKEWEYYSHPVTRFFKTFMESEQEAYEKHMHVLWDQYDASEFKRIDKEVTALIQSRGDYQKYYYFPASSWSAQRKQEEQYEMYNLGNQGR
ncbi:NADH dehydrogenase [ubiquinone] 1 beta subcomplex subunit 5, mitochondrial [Frankliniella fusca]|uniref:NADH dehydrogenase [ubiquinone] 1 beta subcomplex subunit 5, mitochondrial n=1 Tax=Frankliniella fusca TaxID=407009 RepID=A0AAE1H1P8_9NEOP|nr:NADH dehydrogenase [ubiquinone] 1 beta subcomplex subunit 5, mitochondrial [Frankliniella fusca]